MATTGSCTCCPTMTRHRSSTLRVPLLISEWKALADEYRDRERNVDWVSDQLDGYYEGAIWALTKCADQLEASYVSDRHHVRITQEVAWPADKDDEDVGF